MFDLSMDFEKHDPELVFVVKAKGIFVLGSLLNVVGLAVQDTETGEHICCNRSTVIST